MGSGIGRFLFALLIVVWTGQSVRAAEVGSTSGTFAVSPQGSATYSVPIAVPPGTAGMEPSLSVEADSQAGSGVLGLHWSVAGLSQITRCAANFDQDGFFDGVDFQADDKFCLNGNRLIAVSGAYGRNNTEYRLEIEDFSRIVSYGGPSSGPVNPGSFKVWTKSGLIMEFGTTSDSNWVASGVTYTWGVARTSDTVGNYITYGYSLNTANGEVLPSEISYTGNAATGLLPNATVIFNYQARPDPRFGYINGAKVESTKRLSSITTRVNGLLVREYRLGYETPATHATNRSRLIEIEECAQGDNGLVCLPPTVFTWRKQTNTFSWANTAAYIPPYSFVADHVGDMGARLLDVNGDGRVDIVYHRYLSATQGAAAGAYLNTGTGWLANSAYAPPFPLVADGVGDMGARFEDVNGDGLIDFIYHRYLPDTGGAQKGAYLNTGSGWEAYPSYTPPYNIVAAGLGDMAARFIDINGDGLVDLVYNRYLSATQTTIKGAYLNTGGGWQAAPIYAPPYGLIADGVGDMGGRFEDVNGDGLVDLVYNRYIPSAAATIAGAYINTGTGWQANSAYTPPYSTYVDGYGDMGARFEDVNGDGRVDLVYNRYIPNNQQTIAGAYLNTGTGWVANNNYAPPYNIFADGFGDMGARFEDVNGDGLADLLYNRYIPGNQVTIAGAYLNTGGGWTANANYTPPYAIVADGIGDMGVRFADVNGDGMVDVLQGRYVPSSQTTLAAASTNIGVVEQFTSITSGMSEQVLVSYGTLLDPALYTRSWGSTYPINDIQPPMHVVAETRASNGMGGLRAVKYTYAGAKVHLRGRGLLGFRRHTVWDQVTGARTVTDYRQDFPFTGAVEKSSAFAISGAQMSETANTWGQKALGASGALRYFTYAQQSIVRTFEINGLNKITASTMTELEYNESSSAFCGNLSRSKISVFEGDLGASIPYVTINDNTYKAEIDHCAGRLETAVTARTAANDVAGASRTSSFEYDAISGLLSAEIVEPASPDLWLRKEYVRDAYGNVVTTTITGADIAPRSTSIGYDARGQFAVTTTNALGHVEKRTYAPATGNELTYRGPNDVTSVVPTTSWEYDAFGRRVLETRQDGTSTTMTRQWCNGACNVNHAKLLVLTAGSDGSQAKVIVDALGREIAQQKLAFDGNWIRQLIEYNEKGQVARRSVPQFIGYTNYWTTYLYDAAGRVTLENAPIDQNLAAGRMTSFTYDGLTTLQTDALSRKTWRRKNALGQVSEVTDDNFNTTHFFYDAFDNLTVVRDALGNEVTMYYDLRGRKTRMDDPDMGAGWAYQYNAVGELVRQTDAKGQVVRLEYDLLGRMKQRSELEGTTTWTFDVPRKGALGRVTQTAPGGSVVYQRDHAYDLRGRPSYVAHAIMGRLYTYAFSYDSQGRLQDTTYPTGFKTRNLYNGYGYLRQVRDAASDVLYWQGDAQDAWGNWSLATFGNGVGTMRSHDPANGYITAITSDASGQPLVQSLNYSWDVVGNLAGRADQNQGGLHETFTYDDLNRLVSTKVNPVSGNALTSQTDLTLTYDAIGNITHKSDVGNYSYGARPHAVTATSGNGATYTYDANGNTLAGNSRAYTWTSFNLPSSVARSLDRSNFVYGPDRERLQQVSSVGSIATTITYVGGLFERHEISGSVNNKHYIKAGGETIAIHTKVVVAGAQLATNTHYLHRDHRDSVDVITNEQGLIVDQLSYDAWGKRRTVDWLNIAVPATQVAHDTKWGFTGHEHLDNVELIHMSGRVYDPGLGRFTSADPTVQFPENTQGLNRYTYVGNNPFTYTDPSGFAWNRINAELRRWETSTRKELRDPDSHLATGIRIVGVWAASYCGYFAGLCGAAGEFLLSKWQGVSTSDATKNAGAAAIASYGNYYIGEFLPITGTAASTGTIVGNIIAHGVLAGATSELTGGTFRQGFYAGSFKAIFAPAIDWAGDHNFVAGAIVSAAVGGTSADIGGGKFANGAVTAAFVQTLASAADYYEKHVGHSADIRPGENRAGKTTYDFDSDTGQQYADTWRLNVTGDNDLTSRCRQGSFCSMALNLVPGINATAGLHDYWFNAPGGLQKTTFNNWSTMLPAAAMGYGAVLGNLFQGWQTNPVVWRHISGPRN